MEANPLVTVNILSFNRKIELRNTLKKVFSQNYKNIEVIVVDNASNDGSSEMVQLEYPQVILIQNKENVGVSGWNEGFKIAKGEFVLVLDDDSYPENGAIQTAIMEITNRINCAIIAFNVIDFQSQKSITKMYSLGEMRAFVGCGALIRTNVFNKVGYFSELFFIYLHEEDFCIRVIEHGYNIQYLINSRVFHINSIKNRLVKSNGIDKRRFYYGLRNNLIFLVSHFSLSKIIFRAAVLIMGRFIFALKFNCLWEVFKALFSFVYLLPKIIENRNVLSKRTQEFYNYGKLLGGILYQDGDKRTNFPRILNWNIKRIK